MKECIIFGCGGVGSWFADFIYRQNVFDAITLVDFDIIEKKNLVRQNFTQTNIGANKSYILSTRLNSIDRNGTIVYKNLKVESKEDLACFNKNATFVLVATDNMMSKNIIMEYFKNSWMINNDNNHIEIRNVLTEEDKKSWDLGGGYNNGQTMVENVISAALMVKLILKEEYILDGYSSEKKYDITLNPWRCIIEGDNSDN